MPAELGLVISIGRPHMPGPSAASTCREWKVCDNFAGKNIFKDLADDITSEKRSPV